MEPEAVRLAAVYRVLSKKRGVSLAELARCRKQTGIYLWATGAQMSQRLSKAGDKAAGKVAARLYEEYLELFPRGKYARSVAYDLGRILIELKQYDRSFDSFLYVREFPKRDKFYNGALAGAVKAGYLAHAERLHRGDVQIPEPGTPYPARIQKLLEILDLAIKTPGISSLGPLMLMDLKAGVLDDHGRKDLAIPLYKKVAFGVPDRKIAEIAAESLLNALLMTGKAPQVLTWGKKLRKVKTFAGKEFDITALRYEIEAWIEIGRAMIRANKDAECAPMFMKMAKKLGDYQANADVLQIAAVCLTGLGRREEANKHRAEFLRLFPDHPDAPRVRKMWKYTRERLGRQKKQR